MYDVDNSYVLLETDAELKQKWDKHYYLYVKDEKTDMGTDVVVYNENDYLIYVYVLYTHTCLLSLWVNRYIYIYI